MFYFFPSHEEEGEFSSEELNRDSAEHGLSVHDSLTNFTTKHNHCFHLFSVGGAPSSLTLMIV